MKSLLLLIFIITGFAASATTYYFSASGSDANNGTSISTPWQTITKFNAVFASKSPGDNFVFNRGDIFYGTLAANRSGTAGLPITIGAYGTGANPVITGLTTINAWASLGNNIWESIGVVSALSTLNMVVINGVNTPMGRFPNTGYLPYQSHVSNTSITSSGLTGNPNWTGAELIMRPIPWMLERDVITSQSGGTLTYTGGSSAGTNGYGFFIQNDVRTLDAQNEWYYNPITKKIRIYSANSPVNVQVSSISGLVLNTSSFITYDHIDFKGSNSSLLENRNGKNITIQNCSFLFGGTDGIYINSAVSQNETMTIDNNVFSDINENSMLFSTYTSTIWAKNNTINNIGMIPGSGTNTQTTGDGMVVKGANSIIEYNSLTNICHSGIYMIHSNGIIIRNNYITAFGMVRYDAGGVYSWNSDTISVTKELLIIILS